MGKLRTRELRILEKHAYQKVEQEQTAFQMLTEQTGQNIFPQEVYHPCHQKYTTLPSNQPCTQEINQPCTQELYPEFTFLTKESQ